MCTSMLMLQGDGIMLDLLCNLTMFGCFLVFAGELLKEHHTEPQCSNATDSEVHLTANSWQCMEELEHYSTDCNNSPAMTREMPLSDESKQWIAKDTCSGREYACTTDAFDYSGINELIAHQQKMMEQSLKDAIGKDIYSESTDHE